jgi:hypothetical protein
MNTATFDIYKLKSCRSLDVGAMVRNDPTTTKPNHFWIGIKGKPESYVYGSESYKKTFTTIEKQCIAAKYIELKQIIANI